MRNRRGVALLTVVLFSTIVLVVAIAISTSVGTESQIASTDFGFKRALASAETGIAQTVGALNSAKWTSGVVSVNVPDAYLSTTDVEAIAKLHQDQVYPLSLRPFPDGSSMFKVKIRKLSADSAEPPWDGVSSYNAAVKVGIYALGESYASKSGSGSGLLGRRIIYTEAVVKFGLAAGGGTAAFDYGLFSGGEITFKGSNNAKVHNGSIYAIGKIDLHGKDRLDDGHNPPFVAISGDDYVNGAASGDAFLDSGTATKPPKVSFPTISLSFWYDRANDFKTGSNHYASPTVPFPFPYPAARVQAYLGGPGVSPTLDQVQTFCEDLKNGTGAWSDAALKPGERIAFLNSFPDPAFYVVGGGTVAGKFSALGSVVLAGSGDPHADPSSPTYPAPTTLHLSGGATIENLGGLAMFVHGDVMGTGQVKIGGLVYCDGTFDNGSGQLDVTGSIIAMNMSHLSGKFTVTFDPLLNIPTEGFPTEVSGSVSVTENESKSSWVEKSLAQFDSAS